MYTVIKSKIEDGAEICMVIGVKSRRPGGFVFIWLNILSFLRTVKSSKGCLVSMAGVSSPFSLLLVSYWDTEADLRRFIGHPTHIKWMKYVQKNPNSLNLFNETYRRPKLANHINTARGFAQTAVIENVKDTGK